jgi:regulator of RNase E activity RraA
MTHSSGKPGFRILPSPAADPALLARFRGAASSNVADAMNRFNFMDAGIQPRTGRPLSGFAVTVVARPGDNLMVHKALALAPQGAVVVVSTGGNTTNAVFGELMGRSAVAAKLGGLIVDGAVRDAAGLTALGLPVFSRSVCPGACDKDGPGEINVPISCGGVVVMAGDVVVGDADGVAVVPRHDAETVLAALTDLVRREQARITEIDAGQVFRPEIDVYLKKKGVIE